MPKPDITVIIPTYQREEVLLDTIKGMLDQSHKNLEIIVADQSKSHLPATKLALGAIQDERFRYYRISPPSVTAARNFALEKARAPIALSLDDDIVPDKDLVKYHLLAFQEHPEASAIAGRVMQAGFPIKKDVLRFDEYAVSHGVFTATGPGYTNAFPGGNHSIRVADALKVGGYDTRYYQNAFREENDMSLKMARAGMKIYYEPRAEILHLAAPSGGSRTKVYREIRDTSMFYRNELFFTLRAADKKLRIQALRKKYDEYCGVPSRRQKLIRSWYFFTGLVAAYWRIVFGRQLKAREFPV